MIYLIVNIVSPPSQVSTLSKPPIRTDRVNIKNDLERKSYKYFFFIYIDNNHGADYRLYKSWNIDTFRSLKNRIIRIGSRYAQLYKICRQFLIIFYFLNYNKTLKEIFKKHVIEKSISTRHPKFYVGVYNLHIQRILFYFSGRLNSQHER